MGSPPQVRGKRYAGCISLRWNRITPAGAGKTCPIAQPRYSGRGSPPQVRGKPRNRGIQSNADGITPAGAGKTRAIRRDFVAVEDHPRRCGENKSKVRRSRELIGSPPQVRGKLFSCFPHVFPTRITPAGAGKTLSPKLLRLISTGSPPQVRGKPLITKLTIDVIRITPAGAGKTGTVLSHAQNLRDHPRRCGENYLSLFMSVHMPRITPAGAGKTGFELFDDFLRRDHPRRCGENPFYSRYPTYLGGSPPQVRGKQLQHSVKQEREGITPAGAGKTRY